jgi:hypothetical protein
MIYVYYHFNAYYGNHGLNQMRISDDVSRNENVIKYSIDSIIFGNHITKKKKSWVQIH